MDRLNRRPKTVSALSASPHGVEGGDHPAPRRRSGVILFFGMLVLVLLMGLGLFLSSGNVQFSLTGFRNITAESIDREIPRGQPTPAPEATPAEEQTAPPKTEDPKTEPAKEQKEPEPIELAMKEKPGILRGWVVTENSEYPAGVDVRLEFENLVKDGAKGPDLRQKTVESGVFDFAQVPPGKWTIIAESPGYGAGTLSGVTIHSEQVSENIEVLLPPALTLTGSVQTTSGSKLEGVKIVLMKKVLNVTRGDGEIVRREIPYRNVVTSSKGEFTIERAAPGAHVLVATMDGFAVERVEINLEREGKNTVTVELSPAANIGGLVRTTMGLPISNASIELTDPNSKDFKSETKTKSDGSFIVTGLRANRNYRLMAKAPDFAPSGPHEIQAGRMENIIIMETGGAISGLVTNLNSGATAAGIPISLESTGSTYQIAMWTKSDSDGKYRFGDLPTGSYNLRVESDQLTSEPKLGVKVKIPEVTKDINFQVYPGESITGIVAEGDTGTRIAGAKVSIQSRTGPEFLKTGKQEAVTDQTGAFRVDNLPYGLYHLEATAEGYLRYPGPDAQADVRLLPNEISEPVTLLLSPGGTITGTVLDSLGAPVENAVVQLYNTPGARTRIDTGKFKAVTGPGGQFEISGIPLDNEVNVTASAYAAEIVLPNDEKKPVAGSSPRAIHGRAKGKSDPIVLTSFLSTADVVINLGIGTRLKVQVQDQNKQRVEDANVSISHDGFPGDPAPPTWNQLTLGDGAVTFHSVPAGGVTVSAGKSGYIGSSTKIELADNDPATVVLLIEKGSILSGIVYDDAGNYVQEGYVDARPESGSRGGGRGHLDNMGRFKIDTVSEGKFSLSVYAVRQTPTTGKHTIRRDVSGARTGEDIVIEVPMNGAIEGAVYDQSTLEPITSARATLSGSYIFSGSSRTGFSTGSGTQNPPGAFIMQTIPPGKYKLTVTAPNYLPEVTEEFVIESPGTHWGGKIMLSQGATLKGRVVSEKTGEPVIGATAKLSPGGLSGKTNGEGKFTISAITPNIYDITITHGEYLPRLVELVQVKKSGESDAGTIEMLEGGKLFGKVTDGFGRPVIGAVVTLRYADNDEKRTASTDSGGTVRMSGLRAGGVLITVTGNFKRGKVTKNFERVISTTTDTRFDIVLAGELRLEGSILGPQGSWLASPQVEVYPLEADDSPVLNGKIVAEINGSYYKVESLVEGRYLLLVSGTHNGKPVYFHEAATVGYPGANLPLRAPNGQIAGRVFDKKTQKPLADMKIRLRGLVFPQSGVHSLRKYWEFTAKSDEIGYYSFGTVAPGTYELVVTKPGSTDSSLEIIYFTSPGQRLRHDVLWEK